MTNATMTFDRCQGVADRMFAYSVLVTQTANNYVKCLIVLRQVDRTISAALSLLTSEQMEQLTPEQREAVVSRLQEAHKFLVRFASSKTAQKMLGAPLPFIPRLVVKLQEGCADMGDRIENIILMGDKDFLNLIGACAKSLRLDREEDLAGMHDQ